MNLRQQIMHWLWRDDRPRWMLAIVDRIIDPVARLCCAIWGHEPESDQCRMPDHDACLWCLRSMPGKAPRP